MKFDDSMTHTIVNVFAFDITGKTVTTTISSSHTCKHDVKYLFLLFESESDDSIFKDLLLNACTSQMTEHILLFIVDNQMGPGTTGSW